MDVNGYYVNTWHDATCGERAIAVKDGKRYFLKKYNAAIKPHEGANPKLKAAQEKLYNRFVERRVLVNRALASIKDPGVVGVIETFEYQNHFVEVSNLVENTMSVEQVARLPLASKLEAIKSAMLALACIHEAKLIHSDIKPGNLIFAQVGTNVEARFIDFDNSFLYSERTTVGALGGDTAYIAPEAQFAGEAHSPEREKVGYGIDLFSVALTLYVYFTGKMLIDGKGDGSEAWQLVANGNKITVGGEVPEPLRTIIENMLGQDPEKRMSAREAYNMLNGTSAATSAAPPKGSAAGVTSGTVAARASGRLVDPDDGLAENVPWPSDGIEFLPEGFNRNRFVRVQRKMDSMSKEHYYRVETASGFMRNFKKAQLLALGCAKETDSPSAKAKPFGPSAPVSVGAAPSTPVMPKTISPEKLCEVCTPWDGDEIEFDAVALTAFGFVKVERNNKEKKDYKLSYLKNATIRTAAKCVELGYAKSLNLSEPSSTTIKNAGENVLWDGDVGTIDKEALARLKIIRILRCEVGGKKLYRVEAEKDSDCRNPDATLDFAALKLLGIVK